MHHTTTSVAAAPFIGMWMLMTAVMMLPSLIPMLGRYHLAVAATDQVRRSLLTGIAGAAYFVVWAAIGVGVLVMKTALDAVTVQQPSLTRFAPIATAIVIIASGAFQFTRTKAHRLACCRQAPGPDPIPPDARVAWRRGLRLGVTCVLCCFNVMAILLVVGTMDAAAMAIAGAAIAMERGVSFGPRVARAIGVVAIGVGVLSAICSPA